MRRKIGEKVSRIRLPGIDHLDFDTEGLHGKPFMLSFFRFASCPLCNLRVHQLVQRFNEFGDDFTIVAIFDSPLANLIRHAERHSAPFPILADESNRYYHEYSIERSLSGVFKGMVMRMPKLVEGMRKGYLPTVIRGSMTTMPADFLIDRAGVIQEAYYGNDEGDHLPIERAIEFSNSL